MKRNLCSLTLKLAVMIVAVSIVALPNTYAQQLPHPSDTQGGLRDAQFGEEMRQILNDKSGYVINIVRKWERDARLSGRWNETWAADLEHALMNLKPDNLLTVGQASTFKGMMEALATGTPESPLSPDQAAAEDVSLSLGDVTDDLVYTPVTPCRIVDTRIAGGPIAANTARTFDLDGSNLSAQGGSNTGCAIPFGVARAAALTITVTGGQAAGYFTAWGLGAQPLSSVINYDVGQTLANTTIVPDVPGGGSDFSLYSYATAQAVIDVVGYYAAPVATALDCTTVTSAVTAVPVNTWTPVSAICPAGRTATGGGYDTTEGTLGYPGVWLTNHSSGNGWVTWVDNQTGGARNIQTFVNCCRIPGR